MDYWDRGEAYEGAVVGVEHGASDVMAVRVGSVEDYYFHVVFSSSFHNKEEGA